MNRNDITPGDYLLMNDFESMWILAYSVVDEYEFSPFIIWIYDDFAFGYGMKNNVCYKVQKHGREIEYLRECPSTWAWMKWKNPNVEEEIKGDQ